MQVKELKYIKIKVFLNTQIYLNTAQLRKYYTKIYVITYWALHNNAKYKQFDYALHVQYLSIVRVCG